MLYRFLQCFSLFKNWFCSIYIYCFHEFPSDLFFSWLYSIRPFGWVKIPVELTPVSSQLFPVPTQKADLDLWPMGSISKQLAGSEVGDFFLTYCHLKGHYGLAVSLDQSSQLLWGFLWLPGLVITCCLPLWLRCGWKPMTPSSVWGPFAIHLQFLYALPVSYTYNSSINPLLKLSSWAFFFLLKALNGAMGPLDSLGL